MTDVPATLYSFDPATSLVTTVHSFGAGARAFAELFFDRVTGKLYGTTDSSASSPGTVFAYANGVVTTLRSDFNGYGEPVFLDALVPQFDDDGNEVGRFLFGTLVTGGGVFRMKADGSDFVIIHAFSGSTFGPLPQDLTLGSDGLLYGVTTYGGAPCGFILTECGTIFRLKPVLPGDVAEQFETLHNFQVPTFAKTFRTESWCTARMVFCTG